MRLRVYIEFTIKGDDADELRLRANNMGDEIDLPSDAADFESSVADEFENEDWDDARANGPRH